MVDSSIVNILKIYLKKLIEAGYKDCYLILFGSYVKGKQHPLSDIDVLVISPTFDSKYTREQIDKLWHIAARVDSRIEPFPVGNLQFKSDDSSAIIEIARREGEIISLAA